MRTKIAVAERSTVEYGKALDAAEAVADVTAVRALEGQVTAETIRRQRFDDYSSLELWESNNSDADLRAVVTNLSTRPLRVYVRPNARDPQTAWATAPSADWT